MDSELDLECPSDSSGVASLPDDGLHSETTAGGFMSDSDPEPGTLLEEAAVAAPACGMTQVAAPACGMTQADSDSGGELSVPSSTSELPSKPCHFDVDKFVSSIPPRIATLIQESRASFQLWDLEQQNLWLFNTLRAMPVAGWSLHSAKVPNRVAWSLLVGVSARRVARIQKHIASGALKPPLDNRVFSCRVYESGGLQKAAVFFHWLHQHVAEPLAEGKSEFLDAQFRDDIAGPCLADINLDFNVELRTPLATGQQDNLDVRYLAHGSILELYDQYLVWWDDVGNGEKPCSRASFYRAFAEWKTKLRFREQEQHKKCADCCRYAESRQAATSEGEKTKIQKALQGHLELMRLDRNIYKHVSLQSELLCKSGSAGKVAATDAVLVVAIDGMDQAKFCCPRHQRWARSKESESYYRPRLHFTGAIAQGVCEHYFIADADVRKDPASTVEMVSRVLDHTMDTLGKRVAQAPSHLWLQVDNTSRENKNSVVLTWLAWLVARRKFVSTRWQSMMVGHTHNDQDQRFSVVGAVLSRMPILEVPLDFATAIESHVKPARARLLNVELFEAAHDWATFFQPLRCQFHGHTGQGSAHSFTFTRYADILASAQGPESEVDVSNYPGHRLEEDDVCLLVRHHMADTSLSQPPLLVLPVAMTRALRVADMRESVMRRNPMPDDLCKKYLRMAAAVGKPPWSMTRAQQYIEQWVANTQADAQHKEAMWQLRFVFEASVPEAPAPTLKTNWEDFAPSGAARVTVDHGRKRKATAKTSAILRRPAVAVSSDAPQARGNHNAGAAEAANACGMTQAEIAAALVPQQVGTNPEPNPAPSEIAVAPVVPDMAAAPRRHRAGGRRLPTPPPAAKLGCPKCRRSRVGCVKCRKVAGVEFANGAWRWLEEQH